MRLLACVVAIASLQAAVNSQSANPPSNPPSGIRYPQSVSVDVIAADASGRVVGNLKASDFEVREDGTPRTIDEVRFVQASADRPRLVAIFLDEYHVAADATARVREAVLRFIDRELQPGDLLVVMKPLDSILAIHLTTDRAEARAAVESFAGRRGDYTARNSYERDFMAGVPARIDSARTQVALSAINALAVHFSSFTDQRKSLIVVSESVGRVERHRGLEYLPTAETIVRSAQRANVSIYAINPGGQPVESDVLPGLARDTTGESVVADLERGLRRAVDDASGYYLLTYRVSWPDDGKFHAVQVSVKRSGTQLRARSGYFARSPDDTLRAALLAKANEPPTPLPIEPAAHASTLIRPWFGTSRGADGKTRVTFVWEVAPRATVTVERVRRQPFQLVLKALAPDNSVLFEGVVMPTGPGVIDESPVAASRAVFDVPPGRVRLRMAIQDAAAQTLDSDVRSISIRDMRSGVSIGTPEVLRARNAREFRALENEAAVPVASREFSRTERLMIRFRAYGPVNAPVSVAARLLSRMGPMRDLPVTSASDASSVNWIDVPLAGLAVGEYMIEVSATSGTGQVKDLIDFRVTT
jgi:VWFA-related protein